MKNNTWRFVKGRGYDKYIYKITDKKQPSRGIPTKKIEEDGMKKFIIWTVLSVFALSVAGCAGGMGGEKVHVKCPSCGYEFDIQTP
jgi:hypothetical protein